MRRRAENHKTLVWREQNARLEWKLRQRYASHLSHKEKKLNRWSWKASHKDSVLGG